MPELALIFAAGCLASLITGLLFSFFQLSRYRWVKYRTLQKNLVKIGLRWNDLEGVVSDNEDGHTMAEYKKARTTYTIFTVVAVMLSWVGCALLLLIWISIRMLVKSGLETAIFASDLASQELTEAQVKEKWETLRAYE
ncbi:hypothetical protein [Pseudobdellovibrio exovorus]|uniref:Uncharacterized protein n=1 Tax=Pseudobdellovibrio exovorus JSS TaxID=1184267 RepID=M4VD79_9BACT|nr:hypothetical protein [Pseudobdellovibrio exovorus]AGH95971.1 hypothetical protein A11Q_1755 [Pseudobdellovibrio exovorus JSS]